jgi:uncharacterized membrane protein (DUF2068 family)
MNALTWTGTAAGALIAIGTVLRWIIRRAVATGAWMTAAIHLPEEVDRLARSVTALSVAVTDLSTTVRKESPNVPPR